MKHFATAAVLALALIFTTITENANAQNWELIWSDEFEGSSLDLSKWSYQYGTGASEGLSGWGNNEQQYYTDRSQNIFVENGRLHIVALEENFGGMDYTSARIRSIHQGDFRYGRIEARAKMPEGQGLWPAIWMMPTDAVYGGWPGSGEIDIMELVGHEPNVLHGTIHYGPPHNYSGGSYTLPSGNFSDGFHDFAIEWENGEIRWYIDDMLYHTETDWFSQGQGFPAPFDQRFHLLLNVAVGGNWPGNPDNTTTFPQSMEIEYVRVYRDSEADHKVSLPLMFEDLYYDFDAAFTNFDGGNATAVDNPAPGSGNYSDRVGRMVKDGGEFWGGASFDAERPFSFSPDFNTPNMKVWSPRTDVNLLLKFEQQNGDMEYEVEAVTTTSGEWETITWTVDGAGYGTDFDLVTLIFDFEDGQVGDGSENFTWYFDDLDVFGAEFSDPDDSDEILPVTLPVTFEDQSFNWDRVFTGFSGGEITVVANPAPDELNESGYVGKKVKDGGQFWGGSFMTIDSPFVFDEENHHITMKVWSPRENVPVLLKVEQQFATQEYEIAVNTTTSGQWEEMTWDMSGAGFDMQWDIITFIFDFAQGQIGDGSENFTWYFDDVYVYASGAPVSIADETNLPGEIELRQNYPNPFNPTTQIQFTLPEAAEISLSVYDITGRQVANLANGTHQQGTHTVTFDAGRLASGVYLYRLSGNGFTKTQKMLLVK